MPRVNRRVNALHFNNDPSLHHVFYPGVNHVFYPGLNRVFYPGFNYVSPPNVNHVFYPGFNHVSYPGLNYVFYPGLNHVFSLKKGLTRSTRIELDSRQIDIMQFEQNAYNMIANNIEHYKVVLQKNIDLGKKLSINDAVYGNRVYQVS